LGETFEKLVPLGISKSSVVFASLKTLTLLGAEEVRKMALAS
jgi:hypothetical protein